MYSVNLKKELTKRKAPDEGTCLFHPVLHHTNRKGIYASATKGLFPVPPDLLSELS